MRRSSREQDESETPPLSATADAILNERRIVLLAVFLGLWFVLPRVKRLP